jgi:hypothetical protein
MKKNGYLINIDLGDLYLKMCVQFWEDCLETGTNKLECVHSRETRLMRGKTLLLYKGLVVVLPEKQSPVK